MNDPKVEKQKPVPPFVQFCCAAIPQVFDDSLSYYEALCAMWKYLDETVKVINNNAMITEDFIVKVNELHDYVENYFANLDVQEEINNKLDQMALDGTLQEIITTYIQANVTWTFDTVDDMKASTNLIAGSYARTLGFHTLNDGGGATYYITDTGTANEMDIIAVGGLFANLVKGTYVTPEMLGAYSDGVTDDKDYIQRAINISTEVRFKANATYYMSYYVTIHDNIKLDGNFCTLDCNEKNTFDSTGYKNIEICRFKIVNSRRPIELDECDNVHIHDMDISSISWGICLRLCTNFVVEDIVFNQVRTASYSNKDGVHINGGKRGVIRNIYGTTDDDMIALNADEPSEIIGPITDIVIDHVVTKNSQAYGATDSTYRGIRILSRTSLIDNITIKNCNIASDYEECLLIGSVNGGAGNIGRIYVDNCVFTKNHTRTGYIISSEVGYKKLSITNTKLVYNTESTGGFYNETAGSTAEQFVLDNVETIDNSTSERGYFIFRHTGQNINMNNVVSKAAHYFQFAFIRGTIGIANFDNITCDGARYVIRVGNDGTANTINVTNMYCKGAESTIQIGNNVAHLNIDSLTTETTTFPISIGSDQTGLVITANNINSSGLRTLDVGAHTANIRLKGYIITNFTPSSGRAGDTFIYTTGTQSNSPCTYKLYTNGAWADITTA